MKLEKISNDKIKAIINVSDLTNHNIDVHSFLANPLSSNGFFTEILDKADKEIGFNTQDYNIKIEILSLSNVDFIITFTKLPIGNNSNKIIPLTKTQFLNNIKNNFKINNTANTNIPNNTSVYCFYNLNDFYDFSLLYCKMNFPKHIAKEIILYEYNSQFFLVINSLNTNIINNCKIYSIITDFATYVHNSDIFCKKLSEHGKIFIKNNALNIICNSNKKLI